MKRLIVRGTWLVVIGAVLSGGCAGTRSAGTPSGPAAPSATDVAVPASRRAGAGAVRHDPFPAATPEAVVRVTNMIFPAVVRLDVAQEVYTEGKRNVRRDIGSGVIIDAAGHILTNYHVAGRAVEIYVTLASKERVPAKLIGDDHWTDLAVVQLDMDAVRSRGVKFSFAQLGDSHGLLPGQDVMAIGTPFGLARSVTLGVVSNSERTLYPAQLHIDDYETGNFSNWIQMDTPINPGNSGGPLVDLTGKVVGINTRGGGQNLNFAIPINTAKEIVAKILSSASTQHRGRVVRADLGLDLKPLQDLEAFYHIDPNEGVLVNSVNRGSPAQRAGVRTQDILLAINGQPVNVRFPEELASARKRIADLPIGVPVTLRIRRGEQELTLSARPVRLQGAVGEEREMKLWGLSVRQVTPAYANEALLDDDLGVVVTTMSPGYPAALAQLRPGDVIRAIDDRPVEDLEDFTRAYDQSVQGREATVLVQIVRNHGVRSAVLRVSYRSVAPASMPGRAQPASQPADLPQSAKPPEPSSMPGGPSGALPQ